MSCASCVSQRRLKVARRNAEARPTYCGVGVLAGSSGLRAISRISIRVLPFCMNAGRDQSVSQPTAPAYSAHGDDKRPLMFLKS
ncbi:hypothetical protein D3C72_2360810 [compost metagenome]